MAAIRIRVGAALDSSVRGTFDQVATLARRAGQTVDKELGKAGRSAGSSGAAKALIGPFQQTAKEIAKANAQVAASAAKAYKSMAKSAEQAAKARVKAEAAANREIEQAAEQHQRQMTARRAAAWQSAGNIARGVGGALGTMAGAGMGIAHGIARGMGIDLDPGSHMKKAQDLESKSVELSNSSFMSGAKGANGKRQDPAAILGDVRKVANDTATDTTTAMEGLQSFVGLTGDLDTGRKIFGDIAKLSKATGSGLDDMAAAAGNVSNSLEDTPDKAQRVLEVMRALGGQGKLGAVEIKDLASQMAGLAAQAGRFSGSRTDTMALMGALAQESRAAGGSKSAAQAVTSVQSFAGTFDKGAREKQFAARGISLRGKDQLLRSAQDIIVDSLVATKGNAHQMGQLFADTRARSVTRGFETKFNETMNATQGTEQQKLAAATAAVNEEFERLKNAAMGQGEIADSFGAAMRTSASDATIMNNKFTEVAGDFATKIKPALAAVLPGLASLAEATLGAAKKILEFVTGENTTPEKQNFDEFSDRLDKRAQERIKHKNEGTTSHADIETLQEDIAAVQAKARQTAATGIKFAQQADEERDNGSPIEAARLASMAAGSKNQLNAHLNRLQSLQGQVAGTQAGTTANAFMGLGSLVEGSKAQQDAVLGRFNAGAQTTLANAREPENYVSTKADKNAEEKSLAGPLQAMVESMKTGAKDAAKPHEDAAKAVIEAANAFKDAVRSGSLVNAGARVNQ